MQKYEEFFPLLEEIGPLVQEKVVAKIPKISDDSKEHCIGLTKDLCLSLGIEMGTEASRKEMNEMYFHHAGRYQLAEWFFSMDTERANAVLKYLKSLEKGEE